MPTTTKKSKLIPRSNATGRKRLLQLADLLEKDASNKKGMKFDMGSWGEITGDHTLDNPLSCGTQACAMGLAALSGVFKRAGLGYELRKIDSEYYSVEIFFRQRGRKLIVGGTSSASRLFGIPQDHANWLFTDWPENCREGARGERIMAKRLRDYVAGKIVAISDIRCIGPNDGEHDQLREYYSTKNGLTLDLYA